MTSDLIDKRMRHVVLAMTRLVGWLARHWLLWMNTMIAAYLGTAFLAPLLMVTDHQLAGRLIYWAYHYMCHQWPDRSYFLFGPQMIYSLDFLDQWANEPVTNAFLGAPALGYKVAICQRDVAVYGGILLSGIVYAVLRHRVRPLRWWALAVLVLPMAVDGGMQLFGFWESNWWRRTLTGVLFGLACVWWAYPYLDEAMSQVADLCRFDSIQQIM